MSTGSLGGTIEGIFIGKGYRLLRSSPENRLLVMTKGEEVLSIGYTDTEKSSTQGELEMFISISESEEATDMLFISPARIQRELLSLLRSKGIQIWDRTAFVLAIGENELRKASLDSLEEWDAEPDRAQIKPPFVVEKEIDPVAELRRFEREVREKDESFTVTKVQQRIGVEPPSAQIVNAKARTRSFPEMEQMVGGDKAEIRIEAVQPQSEIPVQEPTSPITLLNGTPTTPPPSERVVAALRIDKDEALSMAPGSIKDLQLVYRPYLMMEMSYTIRSKDGSVQSERKGSFMVDLVDGSVNDLPPSAISGISTGARMETGSQFEEMGAIQAGEARRAVEESIRVKDHVLERRIHDGMMSTIYKETESFVVDGSIRTETELEVHMPVWKGRLSFGGMTWMMDGYTGTQRRTR